MKYCVHCGKELFDEAVICPGCGCPTQQQQQSRPGVSHDTLIQTVSERFNINGIIWLVIGCLQILIGIFLSWWALIIGVLNIISAVQDMKYSKEVLEYPVGVVEKVRSLVGPIISLIYNLIFGGVIGVAGNIYYLVAIRGYVMENEAAFAQFAPPQEPVAPTQTNYAKSVEKPTPKSPVPIVVCPNCGKSQFSNAKTCFNCHAPLPPVTQDGSEG